MVKIRNTQTKSGEYIPKRLVSKSDELLIKTGNYRGKEIIRFLNEQIKKSEKEEKEVKILFIEHFIGRKLTNEEKKKLVVYL